MILCVARLWDEADNAQVLDRVAGSLTWPVLLAGEEEHPVPAHAVARSTGAAYPLGHLSAEALACFYRRAALYALPARYDPFDLSVLEAALATNLIAPYRLCRALLPALERGHQAFHRHGV